VELFYVPTRPEWTGLDESILWKKLEEEDEYGRLLFAAKNPQERSEANRFGFRKGINNILAAPGNYLAGRLRSFPHLLITSFDSATGVNRSFRQLFAEGSILRLCVKLFFLIGFSLGPLALAFAGLYPARKNFVALLCASVWLYTILFYLPLWVEYRYFLSAVPFLLINALQGIQWGIEKRRLQPQTSSCRLVRRLTAISRLVSH
jgi:hypothetical protein